MTTEHLIEEARAFADRGNGFNWQGRVRELADALEAEHQRAESARTTGERILADALRYQAAIEQAVEFGESRVWDALDTLTRALNEGDTDDH